MLAARTCSIGYDAFATNPLIAMNATKSKPPGPNNFLFIAADRCHEQCGPECTHKKFMTVARCMMQDGYVYYAHPGVPAVEDDEFGVRHLPLDRAALPHFGSLASVVVLDDKDLLNRAHALYPETRVHLIESSAMASLLEAGAAFAAAAAPVAAAA